MKRLVAAAVVLSLAGALAIALARDAGATPGPKSQFIGDWEMLDGSMISIRGGNGPLHVKFTGDSIAGCPSDGPAMGIGQGVVDPTDPDLLHAHMWVWCRGDEMSRVELEGELTHIWLLSGGMCWDPSSCFMDSCIDFDPFDGYQCPDLP